MSRLSPLLPEQLVAHRGYQRHYPENSPLAIRKAIACGSRWIEIDVQLSADAVPILYHDADLQRISGVRGKLTQYHWRALAELGAGELGRFGPRFDHVRIAPLSELASILTEHSTVQVLVELKEEAVRDHGAGVCLAAIREALAPVLSRCVLISFDLDALREAQRMGFRRLAPILRDWSMRDAIAFELEAELIVINHQRIPPNDSLRMENTGVAVYEVDDIPLAQTLLARGARLVETFAIGELLGNAKPHHAA